MNVQNNKGQTPLHFAFAFGYQELGQCVPRARNVRGARGVTLAAGT